MPRLTPCPACDAHVRTSERTCPHCDARLANGPSRGAIAALGLVLAGCPDSSNPPEPEPEYGVPVTEPVDSGAEPDYGVPDTGEPIQQTPDPGDVAEPEYGVADPGDVAEPEYGVADPGLDEPDYGIADA